MEECSVNQHRFDSFMEALCNVAIGLAIAMLSNMVFIPLITGKPITAAQNGALAGAYTLISLVRSYAIRRAFNGRSIWQVIKKG